MDPDNNRQGTASRNAVETHTLSWRSISLSPSSDKYSASETHQQWQMGLTFEHTHTSISLVTTELGTGWLWAKSISFAERLQSNRDGAYLACVSVGEEVAVDFLKLLHGQMSTGTVFEEAFVPLLNLGI